MIVTDIYNHRFHRIFATNENLSSIMERDDIYVWVPWLHFVTPSILFVEGCLDYMVLKTAVLWRLWSQAYKR